MDYELLYVLMKNEIPKKKTAPSEEVLKLAKRIKEIRIGKGYASHEIFAYEKNIPRAQYGRYERGENMRFDSLMKLIKAFDMSIEEFFGEGF